VLVKHYIYIGKFYLKKKSYQAACKRFRFVKENYPDIPLEEDVDELISRSCPGRKRSRNPEGPAPFVIFPTMRSAMLIFYNHLILIA
jgi:hypothetical protein